MKRIFLSPPDVSGRERELVEEVFASNYVAPAGRMLGAFERAVARYTGIANAVAVNSGTAALHLALRHLGIGEGDEVWTSSMTFIGGASPIVFQRATPVFFDVCKTGWTIDCDLVEEALARAAASGVLPRAIVPTDLYGQSCDLDRLLALGLEYGVAIITDSAEALGARYKDRHAGKGAGASILSFNGNKIITTSGGGMLLSDDAWLIEHARFLSTQAREQVAHYEHLEIGYNYRMSNVSAAIGLGQIEQISEKIARRRQIFARYVQELSVIEGIDFMPEPSYATSTRWLSCVTLDPARISAHRDVIMRACEEVDIEVRPLWKPMHLQPVFAGARFVGPGLCAELFETGLCLPSGSGMTDEDQSRVIDVVIDVLKT